MTRAEVFALTVKRCDAALAEQIEAAEIVLIDLGATAEEIAAAVGCDGYFYKLLQAVRDAQIAETARWLTGGDDTRHRARRK